jgi:hypothetical protein
VFFFDRLAARAWAASAIYQNVVIEKLLPALGNGVRIETGRLGDGAVPAPPEPEGFEPSEEPTLPLVQQAHK